MQILIDHASWPVFAGLDQLLNLLGSHVGGVERDFAVVKVRGPEGLEGAAGLGAAHHLVSIVVNPVDVGGIDYQPRGLFTYQQ